MEKGKAKKTTAKKVTPKVVSEKVTKKNVEMRSIVAGIAMIVAAIVVSAGTYAYYQSTITGTASGTITAWSFIVNEETQNFTVSLGDLKPGVADSFVLSLSAAGSGLGVDATVSFGGYTNWPTNLKLYTDSGHTDEITAAETLTRTLAAGASDTVTVYYWWDGTTPEEGPDTAKTASMTITVVGKQVEQTP